MLLVSIELGVEFGRHGLERGLGSLEFAIGGGVTITDPTGSPFDPSAGTLECCEEEDDLGKAMANSESAGQEPTLITESPSLAPFAGTFQPGLCPAALPSFIRSAPSSGGEGDVRPATTVSAAVPGVGGRSAGSEVEGAAARGSPQTTRLQERAGLRLTVAADAGVEGSKAVVMIVDSRVRVAPPTAIKKRSLKRTSERERIQEEKAESRFDLDKE